MKKNIQAFTLLEVLASLSIVTMVILGPLTSAVNSASYSRQTKDVMVSTYLAEEALELLHYQYNSLYLACANIADACAIRDNSLTPGEQAWKIFKTNLIANSIPGTKSCFDNDGCSYDFLDMMTATSTTPPPKYSPTGDQCSKLSLVTTGAGNYYVCSGVTSGDLRLYGTTLAINKSAYSRKVTITSTPTFETGCGAGAHLSCYYDDLLVTVEVSYRRSNGTLRTIAVTDFLHAR